MCKFIGMLEQGWAAGRRVCIGLDPDLSKMAKQAAGNVGYFNKEIIAATKDLALAYKPNIAFYSGRNRDLMERWLVDTVDSIRVMAPGVPIILDSKRADIGNTNQGYVAEAFEWLGADALTVSPHFGMEAMQPFLDQKDKGVIVLCKTSNKGSGEFQNVTLLATDPPNRAMPMYEYVAQRVAERWNYNGNCLLVVGATYPAELKRVRERVGDMWLLVPGVGTQGGDVDAVIDVGLNSENAGLIINSSSGILYADKSERGEKFDREARRATLELTQAINRAVNAKMEASAP